MGIVWTNKRDVDMQFKRVQEEYDRKSITFMQSVGERAVRLARDNGNYTDRTSNLRNSIGYLIVQNSRVVYESFNGSADEGRERGRSYAQEVGRTLGGYKTFLVMVAGMEYAAYVEAKGYDVISGAENWIDASASKLMDEFRRYLKSKAR